MLTESQKYFVLWTKGHFNDYESPEKVILGEALMIYPNDISENNLLNYSIGVFDKLMQLGAIEGVGEDKFAWIIYEMRQIGNRYKAPTLFEWIFAKIQGAKVGKLSLEMDLEKMKSKMTLKTDFKGEKNEDQELVRKKE